MVSLKDIAKRCGVSVATVSKALNGQRDIGEATRERICRAAEEMGYMPNSAARALKTHRTYNLGVMFVDEQHKGLTHEFFSHILESFKVVAEVHGYDITFINNSFGGRAATYLKHCKYRGVDGVLIACVDFNDPQVVELVNSDVPVVTIDHTFNNRMSVLSDNVAGVSELVRYIHSMGHRKIAFIHGEVTSVTENRLAGFYKTCEELGIDVPEEYVRHGVFYDMTSCAEITRELLALPDPPTCIMFPDDFSAMGGYQSIAEAGLRIPEDISAVGYDGIYLSRFMMPPLTTYHQDNTSIGRVAAERLIALIEHPRTTIPDRAMVTGELLVRGSVRKIK